MKAAPQREKVVEFLHKIRVEFLAEVAKGRSPEEVSKSMGAKIFKGGLMTLQTASMTLKSTTIAATTAAAAARGASASAVVVAGGSAAAPGPIGLIVSGVLFSA